VTSHSKSLRISLTIRVNGLEFREVILRRCVEDRQKWQVAISDRWVGCFALHEGFQLEIRPDGGVETDWQRISLADLRIAALQEAQNGAIDLEEVAPTTCGQREDPTTDDRGIIARIPVEGDSSHVDRLSQALSQARIRFQMVGGLDGRGQGSGHVTLVVSSLPAARVWLWRAGFLESPESKYVLIDSQTGWKVRLLEGRLQASAGLEP
jgi:hypothetical protein